MKVVSVRTMQELDRRTMESGIPGDVLMEQAGKAAFHEMLSFCRRRFTPRFMQRFSLIAGKGNNGGDAYVIAKQLFLATGLPTCVYSVCPVEELKGDAAVHARRLPAEVAVVVCSEELPAEALKTGSIVIDGLLGTGAKGKPRPPYDRVIEQINQSNLPVLAIDTPSGLDADSGAIEAEAIRADITVTMALPKRGQLTPSGLERCGKLVPVDIGILKEFIDEVPSAGEIIARDDLFLLQQRRAAVGHKYTFGKVLVVGGCGQYSGAPLLAANAALRSGSGIVHALLPASTRKAARESLRSMIVHGLPETPEGYFSEDCPACMDDHTDRLGSIVFGPGIGKPPCGADLLRRLLETDALVVIDADGLRILAGAPDLCNDFGGNLILTPHPGEMKVLLNGFGLGTLIKADRKEQARKLAERTGAVVVLKGFGTLVASPSGRCMMNITGSHALATAGTGDVLAGLIGGFAAQGLPCFDAAVHGVFLHGCIADNTAVSARAFTADDLLDGIGAAFSELTPFA